MPDEETTPKAEELGIDTREQDFDNEVASFLDISQDKFKEIVNPTKDTTEVKEETVKEPIEPKAETADEFDFKKVELKGKWNDKEMPVVEMLKEALIFAQTNPDDQTAKDIIANIQKAYDYTEKSSLLKESVKQAAQESLKRQANDYRLLYYEIGNPPLQGLLDPLNETDGEIKTRKDAKGNETQYICFNNQESYLEHQGTEREFKDKYSQYSDNAQKSSQENEGMIADFKKEYPSENVEKLIEDVNKYLNPTLSMGQMPFPKDALKIFYLGKNFDKLVNSKVQTATAKVYEELGGKAGKSTPLIKSEGVSSQAPKLEEEQDFDDGFDMFINGKLNL